MQPISQGRVLFKEEGIQNVRLTQTAITMSGSTKLCCSHAQLNLNQSGQDTGTAPRSTRLCCGCIYPRTHRQCHTGTQKTTPAKTTNHHDGSNPRLRKRFYQALLRRHPAERRAEVNRAALRPQPRPIRPPALQSRPDHADARPDTSIALEFTRTPGADAKNDLTSRRVLYPFRPRDGRDARNDLVTAMRPCLLRPRR